MMVMTLTSCRAASTNRLADVNVIVNVIALVLVR